MISTPVLVFLSKLWIFTLSGRKFEIGQLNLKGSLTKLVRKCEIWALNQKMGSPEKKAVHHDASKHCTEPWAQRWLIMRSLSLLLSLDSCISTSSHIWIQTEAPLFGICMSSFCMNWNFHRSFRLTSDSPEPHVMLVWDSKLVSTGTVCELCMHYTSSRLNWTG